MIKQAFCNNQNSDKSFQRHEEEGPVNENNKSSNSIALGNLSLEAQRLPFARSLIALRS